MFYFVIVEAVMIVKKVFWSDVSNVFFISISLVC